MAKFEIEIDVPEGHAAIAYRIPLENEIIIHNGEATKADKHWRTECIILEKIYIVPAFVPEGWWISRTFSGSCLLSKIEPKLVKGDINIPGSDYHWIDFLNFEKPEEATFHQRVI